LASLIHIIRRIDLEGRTREQKETANPVNHVPEYCSLSFHQTTISEMKPEGWTFHIQIHIPCREANQVFMTYMREMTKEKKHNKEPTLPLLDAKQR
jgi:hypothetical protein